MKIRLIVKPGILLPFDKEAEDVISKWKTDDMIEVEAKKPRNYAHHKKFFALVDILVHQTDIFTDQHECLEWLKIKCGIYKTIKVGDNFYPITGSISFAKMDQDAFNIFYNKAIQSALDILPIDEGELASMIARF